MASAARLQLPSQTSGADVAINFLTRSAEATAVTEAYPKVWDAAPSLCKPMYLSRPRWRISSPGSGTSSDPLMCS